MTLSRSRRRQAEPASAPRRRALSTARARIIAWMLLLVFVALAVLTLVTWRLSVDDVDARMDEALRSEIEEFTNLTQSGIDPSTGQAFSGVDQVLEVAITYNLARPNEKFLGYIDGTFAYQSRQQAPVLLANDRAFTDLVATVDRPKEGFYESAAGEVRYIAVPVSLAQDPRRGVIVAAYFADQEREDVNDIARLMAGAGAATILLVAAGAWVVAGRILRPLRDITATARSITDTDLSRRIPQASRRPGDEIGELVDTVNAMLDRVENAVAVQRRFVDDAGHELRTPITIVRGHLEVLDTSDPDDVAGTLALVEDELMRMNRMVSDLLLLAKSEQPEFLRAEPVDVAALTSSVFDKITGLGEREWVLDHVADTEAVLDPQRITQAVVALADNAARHTEVGGRIAFSSHSSGGMVRFSVKDSGPGVSAEDRERIFERFARGGSGRRSEGAGLGLSIVRAIAAAHGGRVTLDSEPGQGAMFTVEVPVVAAPPHPGRHTEGGR
ncbi:ATP-binding protein [Saccharomonospora azurea]|uniref:histidine kinase n=1 Tax=Saccharomonospora azurea NA-128 TaxID=882081 RepID=H8GD06_9PSEU|nr:HAMP domain-containing sensor histidine kinase [Saccharomonospora azurea]EHK87751.1 signal transduction histidine kinase [Saccharomonospora azurea SZMC 14600]EHY88795.1 signal transduction histidine kinase [Saccharomonospora azurea NA-128]